jgi:hypothetical protein
VWVVLVSAGIMYVRVCVCVCVCVCVYIYIYIYIMAHGVGSAGEC